MVQVDFAALTLASLKAVGQIEAMIFAGFLMTRIRVISNEGRKCLGELSMNLLIPCRMFSAVIYCNAIEMNGQKCPNMAQTITSSIILFFWPLVIVGIGYCVGSVAAMILQVPANFRRAAAGSVAFGNSTGMPVVLLSASAPALIRQGVLAGSPLLFLPVYLGLTPLLQWTVGSYIFRGPKMQAEWNDGTSTSSDSDSSVEQPAQAEYHRRSTAPLVFHRVDSPMYDEDAILVKRHATMTIGEPPLLSVGNGISAQAEVDDVLVPEDIALPQKRDKIAVVLKKVFFMFVSPPVAAFLLGILVAFFRPIQNQFENLHDHTESRIHSLDWVYTAVRKMGEAAVPVNLIMLGSSLSKGADFKAIPMSTAIVLALTKMWIQPAAIAGLVFLFSRLGPFFKGQWLVALVVSLTPTAHNIMVQVEVGGQDKAAMKTLIFVQYLLSPVLLTVSLTAVSALMEVDGFLPAGGHAERG